MNKSDILRIKETIFKTVDFKFDGDIEVIDFDGIYVDYKGGSSIIGANSLSALARAYFLFAKEISSGKKAFTINQKPHFKTLGAMIDMSRNGVMTVDAIKDYINKLAALGFNMLMLYTEDTYELKNYKYFGYMRGRYTEVELHQIDIYADSMGVEVIPCIQTLAHLSQFLKWDEARDIRDTGDILLIDEEKTYEFIKSAIATMRRVFHTNRIHIGMDEAHNVGLGKFLDKNGYQNRFEILNRHLKRVVDICKDYDFLPMMWSDMFFRLASQGSYSAAEIPKEVAQKIPDVELVYWDYYNNNENVYNNMIKSHKTLGKEIAFAGGCGLWYGFLPWFEYSFDNSVAAMKSCIKNNIETVFTTMWGDDGCETNIFYSLALLPVYSESCYRGEDCTEQGIVQTAEFLTKMSFDAARDMGKLNPSRDGQIHGKEFIYSDILYDLGIGKEKSADANVIYTDLQKRMEEYMQAKDINYKWYIYAYYLYKICATKAELRCKLRDAYKSGNKEYLYYVKDNILPSLKSDYSELSKLHRNQWMSTYKPFGYEVLSFRYGGIMQRIDDVIITLSDYLTGKLEFIDELEQEAIPTSIYFNAKRFISPSDII